MHYLPGTTTVEEVISLVKKLNFSEEIHGINIHPFTDPSNQIRISQVVDYNKDVEGLHFLNMGRFLSEDYEVAPFMAKCIMKMIEFTGEELKGKKAVIIGRSRLLDIPLSLMLLNKNATVTICHPHTADLSRLTKDADILVAAAGHPASAKRYG